MAMPYSLDDKLVVAVALSALFDLGERDLNIPVSMERRYIDSTSATTSWTYSRRALLFRSFKNSYP